MTAQLDQMIERGEVPNVLLFTGPKQIASLLFAKEFAKKILGPQHAAKIDSGHHPDLHFYEIEGKSGTHPIVSLQHLVQEIYLPPLEAKVKVFIIDDAHRMLPSSSNSLLKTLEEPTVDSLIILLSNRPELMLPTIVSRCRKVPLGQSIPTQDFSLGSAFKAAKEKDYPALFKEVSKLEEVILKEEAGSAAYFEKIDQLFEALLKTSGKLKTIFPLQQCQLALERNLKLRTVLLNFFLTI